MRVKHVLTVPNTVAVKRYGAFGDEGVKPDGTVTVTLKAPRPVSLTLFATRSYPVPNNSYKPSKFGGARPKMA